MLTLTLSADDLATARAAWREARNPGAITPPDCDVADWLCVPHVIDELEHDGCAQVARRQVDAFVVVATMARGRYSGRTRLAAMRPENKKKVTAEIRRLDALRRTLTKCVKDEPTLAPTGSRPK